MSQRYPKSERHVTENDSSCVRRKRSGELWFTVHKVVHVSLDPPKSTFSTDYISALRGCLPLKFLHALEFDEGLLAHTTNWVRCLPKNFKGEHLKLGLKFHIGAHITLGVVGVTSWNFTGDVDQVDTNFVRGAPYKIWESKKCPKFSSIFDTFRFWSQISQERIDMSKIWIALDQLHFIPCWSKKFGKFSSTNQKVIDAHVDPPNWTFSGIINFGP